LNSKRNGVFFSLSNKKKLILQMKTDNFDDEGAEGDVEGVEGNDEGAEGDVEVDVDADLGLELGLDDLKITKVSDQLEEFRLRWKEELTTSSTLSSSSVPSSSSSLLSASNTKSNKMSSGSTNVYLSGAKGKAVKPVETNEKLVPPGPGDLALKSPSRTRTSSNTSQRSQRTSPPKISFPSASSSPSPSLPISATKSSSTAKPHSGAPAIPSSSTSSTAPQESQASSSPSTAVVTSSTKEAALNLYRQATRLEREGNLSAAVNYYRKANRLYPNIDTLARESLLHSQTALDPPPRRGEEGEEEEEEDNFQTYYSFNTTTSTPPLYLLNIPETSLPLLKRHQDRPQYFSRLTQGIMTRILFFACLLDSSSRRL
jgi:hypothetical protein